VTPPVTDERRILYLIDRVPNTAGGAEGVLCKMCRRLPALGFNCSVVTFYAGEGVAAEFPCPVHVLPLSSVYHWTSVRHALTLARLLRSEQIDIVHTFFPTSDLWGSLIARLGGCRIVVSSRRDMGILRSGKHRVSYRLANRLFTQVQAVSEGVREFCIREDRIAPEQIVTVPNGIDLESIEAAPRADRLAVGVRDGAPVVITVANLRLVKGIDILIRAAALVVEHFSDVRFVVVGGAHEASYLRELIELARSLGVEQNILFLDARKDVYSLLKAADLFCLPSRSEGMSNALLEAMGCGLPCVATNVGGNSEVVIDGQTGCLVPSENPHKLAAAIIDLLRDRNLMKCMGEAGRKRIAERFSIQRMMERLAFLYDELLERQNSPASVARGPQRELSNGKEDSSSFRDLTLAREATHGPERRNLG
jgi:L-malate glycosyltransferase